MTPWRPVLRRRPGSGPSLVVLALALESDVCWTDLAFVPTIQGQYLIKDAIVFTAAMVIGGNRRRDRDPTRPAPWV